MATISINTPDGKTIDLNTPDGASPDQIRQAAQMAVEHYKQSNLQQSSTPLSQSWDRIRNAKGFFGTTNQLLKEPQQLSSQGLSIIANATPTNILSKTGQPTGNLVQDIMGGTPKIAAETMAQVAPSFVSREALLTGAVLGPGAKLARGIGRGITGLQESFTGVPRTAFQAVANDASLLGAEGKEAVSKGYEVSKGLGGVIRSSLSDIPNPKDFVIKAVDLAKTGKLNSTEALEARKMLDMAKNELAGPYYKKTRSLLDTIAKQAFAGNDAAYQRALMAEQLRNIGPINNSGKQSIMRIAGALASRIPAMGFAVSPAFNASIDAAAGTMGNALFNNPGRGVATAALLNALARMKRQ